MIFKLSSSSDAILRASSYQGSQSVGSSYGLFRLLDLHIGRRELLGGAARTLRFDAQVLGERVGQRPDHRQKDHAEDHFADIIWIQKKPQPVKEQIEGNIGARGNNGDCQRAAYPKRGSRRKHRQGHHQPVRALQVAGISDQ